MEDVLPDDGLKWFGEGFDGFPKRLPDDCVEYIIYCINDKLSSLSAVRTRLNEFLKLANELKKRHLKDYIWQRDEFKLSLDPGLVQVEGDETQIPTPPRLRGQTNFGDSIADEWFIVWLLREISRAFPDAWIRIYDTDGEFLLIEAANALPRWLSPEIAENRVWVNAGQLKIIPLSPNGRDTKSQTQRKNANDCLGLSEALSILRNPQSTSLLVDSKIQDAAFERIATYPAALSTHLHYASTTLPRKLAWLLHSLPTSIAAATEAFYLRDAVSLRPLATKDLATLRFPPEDLVDVSVAYTRVGFAQLRGQVLSPVPPAWVGVAPRVARGDAKMEAGVKVACGFEMLMRDPAQKDSKVVREVEVLLSELEEEGGDVTLPSDEEIKGWNQRVDTEDWLDVDYKDLEKELEGKGTKVQEGEKDGEQTAQENLRQVVDRFRKFMDDDDADIDGIDDMDDDDGDDDDDDDVNSDADDKPPTEEEHAKGQSNLSGAHVNGTLSDDEDSSLNPAAPPTAYPTSASSIQPPVSTNPGKADAGELNGTSFGAKTSSNEKTSPDDWQSHLATIEFEKAISDIRGMSAAEIESSGLLAEARKLALEDSRGDRDGNSSDQEDDEDAELEKIMALMEKELRDRGALDLGDGKGSDGKKSARETKSKPAARPVFGPERPPHMLVKTSAAATALDDDDDSDNDSDTIPSDVESDADDDQDFNNVDLNLARNLLSAFQGEAGQAGPAGNLMRALGVTGTLPRDEDAGRITEEK